jgi:hypothetical protein
LAKEGGVVATPETREPVSGWVVGFAYFAGAIMILIGIFHAIAGLGGIFEDDFYVLGREYVFDVDVTAWGWIHLIGGLIVIAAGIGIYSGAPWARTVGVILAGLSAIANFFFIPYYPVWSVLIIALDIVVILALTVFSREAARGY